MAQSRLCTRRPPRVQSPCPQGRWHERAAQACWCVVCHAHCPHPCITRVRPQPPRPWRGGGGHLPWSLLPCKSLHLPGAETRLVLPSCSPRAVRGALVARRGLRACLGQHRGKQAWLPFQQHSEGPCHAVPPIFPSTRTLAVPTPSGDPGGGHGEPPLVFVIGKTGWFCQRHKLF